MHFALIGPVHPFRGGIAHFNTQLALALEKEHQVSVISYKRLFPKFLYPGKSVFDPSLETPKLSAHYWLDSISPINWRQTANKIADLHPSAAIIQWWVPFLAPALGSLRRILQRRQIPVYYVIHNVMPHESHLPDRVLIRWALKDASGYLVQTEREANRLRELIPASKIQCSPHPIYGAFNQGQSPNSQRARQQLGLPQNASVILFFGIIRPYKGLGTLLEAVAKLKASGENIFLYVAGEFWESIENYRQMVQNLNIQEQVKFDDRYIPNEELPVLFSAADVFAAPYLHGTQSGSVRMAMGFGTPIVISDTIYEDVLANLNVLTFPAGNPNELAKALQTSLRSPHSTPEPANLLSWEKMALDLTSLING